MKLNQFFPELRTSLVEHDDGLVCGLIILVLHEPNKIFISYRSDLYKGTMSTMSMLNRNKHTNHVLQTAYNERGKKEWFNYPTDTVGSALDLKNSLLDEYAKHDIFVNIRGTTHVKRVLAGLARGFGRKSTPLIIEGQFFINRRAAAIFYGFTESTISYRINSDAYPRWNEVEERSNGTK